MVSFGRGDDRKAPRLEDLDKGDQFRVAIGKIISNAMMAAMGVSARPAFQSLGQMGRAEIMASITVSFVGQVEDVIARFAEEKGDDE